MSENRAQSDKIDEIPLAARLQNATATLQALPRATLTGRVSGVCGLAVTLTGINAHLCLHDRVWLAARDGRRIPAELVALRAGHAEAMAFAPLDGIGPGIEAHAALPVGAAAGPDRLRPDISWLGRVLGPLGEPIDGRSPLAAGPRPRPRRAPPPLATHRARLGPAIDLGVRALDAFATCRQGQRLGLFAGSGVGKSTLLSMLARNTAADVAILALVGERGREVREFLEDDLGADGLARAVVVVATSDAPPLARAAAAETAMTIAEHFRDEGRSVLLMMDSVTRYCLALREIGLSAGEPPATRGYPPSVFATLPRLLERAGPGIADRTGHAGQITALFTVLVEGDDHNEPVADAVRGILDGHVVLDRAIGEAGRYPAIDVLRSLSRAASGVLSPARAALAARARAILALHAQMADMVRLGAYKQGSDPAIDEAIRLTPRIEAVLRQTRAEADTIDGAFAALARALEA